MTGANVSFYDIVIQMFHTFFRIVPEFYLANVIASFSGVLGQGEQDLEVTETFHRRSIPVPLAPRARRKSHRHSTDNYVCPLGITPGQSPDETP